MFLPGHVVLVGYLVLASQSMPHFDIGPACRAARLQTTTKQQTTDANDPAEICRAAEQKARQQLLTEWQKVSAADKAKCVPLSSLGGAPTYTELLTCIELTREARRLRAQRPEVPLPQAIKPAPTTDGQNPR